MLRTKLIQLAIDVNEKIFFYPKLRKFYREILGKQPVFLVDVGVNKGQSIDFFLGLGCTLRVLGFEPNKKLYNRLQKKYSNNPNIRIINKGVSESSGTLLFQENVLDETSTFETLNYDSEYLQKKARVLGVKPTAIITNKYEVKVLALNSYFEQEGITNVDVLKIDVEGHELSVLRGLFTDPKVYPKIRFIQLESHSDDMYLHAGNNSGHIEKLLKDNGFTPVAAIKHGFGDFSEIIYKNSSL